MKQGFWVVLFTVVSFICTPLFAATNSDKSREEVVEHSDDEREGIIFLSTDPVILSHSDEQNMLVQGLEFDELYVFDDQTNEWTIVYAIN